MRFRCHAVNMQRPSIYEVARYQLAYVSQWNNVKMRFYRIWWSQARNGDVEQLHNKASTLGPIIQLYGKIKPIQNKAGFQVLTAASMKMNVLWDVAPCSLV
jgi:hypothetical protein